ncbi:hypothetical protein amrb99_54410 [Actinomadura sp. RB99]|uniref:hypothetical protein n=1 Tax=Actinomadura sp. RB99 TaxID=2691577 RepID=UPI0016879F1C|nr:hypothetical protein [Actinomadura sp. RB99]MBD2896492.1 hypothetical protein [Actinomadura sp. RB99]
MQVAARTPPTGNGIRRVFDVRAEFDPARVEREFTIITSDYAVAVLGPIVARLVAGRAPGVRLRMQQTGPHVVDHAAETLRTVALAIRGANALVAARI